MSSLTMAIRMKRRSPVTVSIVIADRAGSRFSAVAATKRAASSISRSANCVSPGSSDWRICRFSMATILVPVPAEFFAALIRLLP